MTAAQSLQELTRALHGLMPGWQNACGKGWALDLSKKPREDKQARLLRAGGLCEWRAASSCSPGKVLPAFAYMTCGGSKGRAVPCECCRQS